MKQGSAVSSRASEDSSRPPEVGRPEASSSSSGAKLAGQRPSVRLNVRELVVQGLGGCDGDEIARAVQNHLQRLLSARGVSESLARERSISELDGAAEAFSKTSRLDGAAEQIARKFFKALP